MEIRLVRYHEQQGPWTSIQFLQISRHRTYLERDDATGHIDDASKCYDAFSWERVVETGPETRMIVVYAIRRLSGSIQMLGCQRIQLSSSNSC